MLFKMSGMVVSVTEAVNSGSIPGRVKPKTIKIGIHSFLLDIQQLKGQCEAPTVCGRKWAGGNLTRRLKVSPGQGNKRNVITITNKYNSVI